MKKRLITIVLTAICAFAVNDQSAEAMDVNIHGFVSQGFLKSNEYNYLTPRSKDGSFEYNEMGVNFSSQLKDKLHAGLQLFTRDLGDAANNKITLDWAYADYRFQDWLGLRAGRIKLPLGLYNEIRDMDMLRTSIVLPQGIYRDLNRDALIALNGVGLYGNVDLETAGSLEYQLLTGVLNLDKESGIGKVMNDSLAGAGGELNGNFDPKKSYAGALWWGTPLEGFRVGYSFFDVTMDVPLEFFGILQTTMDYTALLHIFSAEYTWNDIVMAAEYKTKETNSTVLGTESSTTGECYYLSASYTFNNWFTFGTYYTENYPDKDDKEGKTLAVDHNAWEKDLALTLRFDINEYWVFKIEGHSVNGTANVLAADNTDNNFSKSDWSYGAAKITFSF